MLVELKELALEVIGFSWPMIVISVAIIASLRLVYLRQNNLKVVLYDELFKLFFIIYILCLFQVVTYQDVSFPGINIVPFKEIFRYEIGTRLFYKNILGNMFLFLPFGFFVSHYIKINKLSIMLFLSLIASLAIEITQLSIGRVFDVDDIILNIIGAILGFYLYQLLDSIVDKIPEKLKKNWILNVLAVLLILLLVRFLVQ